MDIILYILIFCMGTVFGSFFTLAVYRLPLGKNITHERSFCTNCNHKLTFLDMIPLLSYLFLGGKCRYCKQPIRIRYFLLEIFSGIVFVLFAFSIQLSLYDFNISTMIYFVFGLLYLASLFIIAGIDKEKIKIQTSVLLFAIIVAAVYMIYLYIVEKTNIYRYVIYLFLLCLLLILDTIHLRKKAQSSYQLEVLMLILTMGLVTYEACIILTIQLTLLSIAFTLLLEKGKEMRKKCRKIDKKGLASLPIAFYLCVSNIVILLTTNLYIFYRG